MGSEVPAGCSGVLVDDGYGQVPEVLLGTDEGREVSGVDQDEEEADADDL